MKYPRFIGKIVYFCGYPVLWAILHDSTRAYVLVQVKNEVLLTKNWLGFHKLWRLPGGGLKPGENPRAAVLRELSEETAIIVKLSQLKLLQTKPFRNESFGFDYYLFILNLSDKPTIKIDKYDVSEAAFVGVKNIETKYLSVEAQNAIKLAKQR